ncbi:hypothetical protein B296_00039794 [Ensete ventricosum]|uniref:Uncharacterized protein n=1 Tax=Ensete ventricosum TaxID=4639 RepID=A0A426X9H1_ENSVE|nr:hypothetical protein B296_00039794 [Ensete ventricosum]
MRRAPAGKGDLAERANSGTNLEDLAERANSGTNPRDLAERVNSETNPGDLAERANSGTNHGDFVERVNSGTNSRDLAERAHTWFGRSRHVHLGGCSGGQCLVSSASTHKRVPKMVEDLPQPGSANLWRYLVVFLGECRGAGIILTRDLFIACPSSSPATREVGASLAREASKDSSKRPLDAPTEQADDPTRRHKKVKVLTRRHKSRLGEGESRSRSKGKEPATRFTGPSPLEVDEGPFQDGSS